MKRVVRGLQSRVMAKQTRRAYLRLKLDVTNIQKYIRRYLAIQEILNLNDIRHKI